METRRLGTWLLLVVVAVVAVSAGLPVASALTAGAEQPGVATNDVAELPNATDAGSERVPVIVEFTNDSMRQSVAMPDTITVTGGQDVDFMPVVFAEGPASAFERLEERAGVVAVRADTTVGVEPPADNDTVASTSEEATVAGQTVPWGVDRLSAQAARDTVSDDAVGQVDVAILDTGIDYTHDDLETVSWGANFSAGVEAYGRSTALDNHGHGTAMAGVLAAADDNSDVVGVSPGVDTYSIKVMNESGEGRLSWIVSGIDASLKGPDGELGTGDDAEVLSLSLGSFLGDSSLQSAIDSASDHAVVVAAAGNSGDGDTATDEVEYPARYDDAIAVAASDQSDETPTFSAEGDAVELAAPGVRVTTTELGGGTITLSGTSIATPHVAGTAALVIAQDLEDGSRDRSSGDVQTRLRETALDIESDGVDKRSGYGLVIATDALDVESTGSASFTVADLSPDDVSVVQGESIDVSATVANTGDESGSKTITLQIDGSTVADRSVSLAAGGSTTVSFDGIGTDDLSLGSHTYGVASPSDERTATVSVQEPATFTISDLSPENITVTAGETVDVSATVTNTGEVSGSKSIDFRVDGETVTSESLTLSSGASESVSFTLATDEYEPGTYRYRVGSPEDSRNGSVIIKTGSTLSIDGPNSIVPGREAEVTVTVVNTGSDPVSNVTLSVSSDANVTVDPATIAHEGSLAPGESWERTVSVTLAETYTGEDIQLDATGSLGNKGISRSETVTVVRTAVDITGPDQVHASPGTTTNVTVSVTNRGITHPDRGKIEVTSIQPPVSISGQSLIALGFGTPVPEPGDTVDHVFAVDVGSSANGTYPVTVDATFGGATDSTTVAVTTTDDWYGPYTTDEGVVNSTGLNAAVKAYLGDELSSTQLNTLVKSYLSGDPIE